MTITLEIPVSSEAILQSAFGPDLGRAALEALIVEGFQKGKLSTADIAEMLDLNSRMEAEQWLANRGVSLNYTLADLNSDRVTLNRVLGVVAK